METQVMVLNPKKTFNWEEFLTPDPYEQSEKLLEERGHYERLGLKKSAKEVNLRLMALAAEQKGLILLEARFYMCIPFFKPWGNREPHVIQIIGDKSNYQHEMWQQAGRSNWLGHMNIIPLKKFSQRIPMDILEKLPTDTGDAVVFTKASDPIIAVPIGQRGRIGYYLGVFVWR